MEIWNGEIMPIDLLKHGENKIGMKRKFQVWKEIDDMINIFGTDFIEVKNESVSINITTLETGQKLYSVSGGIKNGTRLKTKEFKTPNECIDELRERVAYSLLEL